MRILFIHAIAVIFVKFLFFQMPYNTLVQFLRKYIMYILTTLMSNITCSNNFFVVSQYNQNWPQCTLLVFKYEPKNYNVNQSCEAYKLNKNLLFYYSYVNATMVYKNSQTFYENTKKVVDVLTFCKYLIIFYTSQLTLVSVCHNSFISKNRHYWFMNLKQDYFFSNIWFFEENR